MKSHDEASLFKIQHLCLLNHFKVSCKDIFSTFGWKLWNFFSQEGAVFILYKLLGCFVEYLIGYLGTN